MNEVYAGVLKQEAHWWIGWIEEVPDVNCRERTQEELIETLKITLQEALEFNRHDALSAAEEDFLMKRTDIYPCSKALRMALANVINE